MLEGLSIVGLFYNEVIPSARELLGYDKNGVFLPRSCRYLFHVYHKLLRKVENHYALIVDDGSTFDFKAQQGI